MLMHCSSEEKAVWKWIYFWLPQKVTERGTGMLCGKPRFVPWSRSKSFYLNASISSCLQLVVTLSTLQTYVQRARKSKGHYQDSIPGSMVERIAAPAQARQRQTLGEFSALYFKVRIPQKVNSSYLLDVMVAIGGFHPSHPKNESPSINSLPTQADHHACWRTTSTADWTTKMPFLRKKKKWSSARELLCFAVTPSIMS